MTSPLLPLDIFLHPGDHYFADRDTRIRTVLGSCVAMTFWHPQLLVGGMCHYMLPKRVNARGTGGQPGRYADTAVALLLEEMDAVGAPYKEYQVKLFGGGSMFPDTDKTRMPPLGIQNVQAARRLAKQHGFTCVAEHLGDTGHRDVIFEVWSGEVWVKHSDVLSIAELEPISRDQG
ncbi:MAG TPA: chemotaxis protein CheD [Methylobacter sp.]|jgi:chemotaxis protein CheD